jgi:hypothetical protein
MYINHFFDTKFENFDLDRFNISGEIQLNGLGTKQKLVWKAVAKSTEKKKDPWKSSRGQ